MRKTELDLCRILGCLMVLVIHAGAEVYQRCPIDSPDFTMLNFISTAVRSGVPIVPMYIKPKQKPSDRLTVVLGERVSVTELYGDRPTFAQIDAATRLLYEREAKLAELLRD